MTLLLSFLLSSHCLGLWYLVGFFSLQGHRRLGKTYGGSNHLFTEQDVSLAKVEFSSCLFGGFSIFLCVRTYVHIYIILIKIRFQSGIVCATNMRVFSTI